MKTRLAALAFLVCLTAHAPGQSVVFDGRWLVKAAAPGGGAIPLMIIEVAGGAEPQVTLLSSTAPFPIAAAGARIESDRLVVAFEADQRPITMAVRPQGDGLQGTLDGLATGTHAVALVATRETEIGALADRDERRAFRALNLLTTLIRAGAGDAELEEAAGLAIRHSAERGGALNSVAYTLALEGRLLDRAESWAREAVAGVEEGTRIYASFIDTLGWVLYRQQRFQEAAAWLREAHRIAPDHVEITAHLAQALERQGELAEAGRLYLSAYVRGGGRRARQRLEENYRREHGTLSGLHDLIDREYARIPPPFEAGEYEGPVPQRTVLAELFTGAECPPCVAADHAFKALIEHYPRPVVSVLEYHLHIPGPDPLTNPHAEGRGEYYGVRGTPTAVFSGSEIRSGGGLIDGAEILFDDYRVTIAGQLDRKAPLTLAGSARREGDDVDVTLRVRGGEGANGGAWKLHVALVEGTVHYTGGNGTHFHRQVVRQLLTGPRGAAFQLESDFQISTSLDVLEHDLGAYLDSIRQNLQVEFDGEPHALDRDNLGIVAWVQDEESREILNAATIPLDRRR